MEHKMWNERNGGGERVVMTIQEFARELHTSRDFVKRMISAGTLNQPDGTLIYDDRGRPHVVPHRFYRVFRRHNVRRKPQPQ